MICISSLIIISHISKKVLNKIYFVIYLSMVIKRKMLYLLFWLKNHIYKAIKIFVEDRNNSIYYYYLFKQLLICNNLVFTPPTSLQIPIHIHKINIPFWGINLVRKNLYKFSLESNNSHELKNNFFFYLQNI